MPKSEKIMILAIETSADETSAAVLVDGRLKSNIIYSQIAQHAKTGGIVPEGCRAAGYLDRQPKICYRV